MNVPVIPGVVALFASHGCVDVFDPDLAHDPGRDALRFLVAVIDLLRRLVVGASPVAEVREDRPADAFSVSLGSRQGFFDDVETCTETAFRDGVERFPRSG